MSLIVCSNELDYGKTDYDRQYTNQASYRFTNHLVNPIDIEPDSEVAVVNVKCNKDGLVSINAGDRWFQYLGIDVRSQADGFTSNDSINFPIQCRPHMANYDTDESMSLSEFADRITRGMIRGIPHPDYQAPASDGASVKCEIARTIDSSGTATTSGHGFAGFKFTYKSADGQFLDPKLPKTFGIMNDNNHITITDNTDDVVLSCNNPLASTGSASPDIKQSNMAFGKDFPLSHMNGKMDIDLTGLGTIDGVLKLNTDWQIGLSRATTNNANLQQNYNPTDNEFSAFNTHPFDFVVQCSTQSGRGGNSSNRWLQVGHLVKNPRGDGSVIMKSIQYYKGGTHGLSDFTNSSWNSGGGMGGKHAGQYNFSTNTDDYRKLRFEVKNEKVVISLYSHTGGAWVVVTDPDLVSSQDAKKENIPKPAGQTCWNLYPKVVIGRHLKSCKIEAYSGRNTGGASVYADNDKDWFCRMWRAGMGRYTKLVDCSQAYDIEDSTLHTYKGVTDHGTENAHLTGYFPQMILQPALNYFENTEGANLSYDLGFPNRAICDQSNATRTDGEIVYVSDAVPTLQSYESMFIRLDNFTQRAYNAGVGRPSKILYHCPRFDSSNRETGTGLYFEPASKTYIRLGNTQKLKLNELNLSICNNREQLIDDLTGQTIICLHFRKHNPLHQ